MRAPFIFIYFLITLASCNNLDFKEERIENTIHHDSIADIKAQEPDLHGFIDGEPKSNGRSVPRIQPLQEYRDDILTKHEGKKNATNPSSPRVEPIEGGAQLHSTQATDNILLNYASFDAGARVVVSNSEATAASSVILNDPDKYYLSPCESKRWIVIELSEEILAHTVMLANLELFSSAVKDFQVLGSSVYPVDQWILMGTFRAEPTRGPQYFRLEHPALVRYIKLRLVTHYGSEFYCTLSKVKVFGQNTLEQFKEAMGTTNAEVLELLESLHSVQAEMWQVEGDRPELREAAPLAEAPATSASDPAAYAYDVEPCVPPAPPAGSDTESVNAGSIQNMRSGLFAEDGASAEASSLSLPAAPTTHNSGDETVDTDFGGPSDRQKISPTTEAGAARLDDTGGAVLTEADPLDAHKSEEVPSPSEVAARHALDAHAEVVTPTLPDQDPSSPAASATVSTSTASPPAPAHHLPAAAPPHTSNTPPHDLETAPLTSDVGDSHAVPLGGPVAAATVTSTAPTTVASTGTASSAASSEVDTGNELVTLLKSDHPPPLGDSDEPESQPFVDRAVAVEAAASEDLITVIRSGDETKGSSTADPTAGGDPIEGVGQSLAIPGTGMEVEVLESFQGTMGTASGGEGVADHVPFLSGGQRPDVASEPSASATHAEQELAKNRSRSTAQTSVDPVSATTASTPAATSTATTATSAAATTVAAAAATTTPHSHHQNMSTGVQVGSTMPTQENIFKVLTNKIKSLEINQSVFDHYLEKLNDRYSDALSHVQSELDLCEANLRREVSSVRAEIGAAVAALRLDMFRAIDETRHDITRDLDEKLLALETRQQVELALAVTLLALFYLCSQIYINHWTRTVQPAGARFLVSSPPNLVSPPPSPAAGRRQFIAPVSLTLPGSPTAFYTPPLSPTLPDPGFDLSAPASRHLDEVEQRLVAATVQMVAGSPTRPPPATILNPTPSASSSAGHSMSSSPRASSPKGLPSALAICASPSTSSSSPASHQKPPIPVTTGSKKKKRRRSASPTAEQMLNSQVKLTLQTQRGRSVSADQTRQGSLFKFHTPRLRSLGSGLSGGTIHRKDSGGARN
eukprot:Rmarinus@m.20174